MLIPYNFDLFKGVFWFKYRILHLEENHVTIDHIRILSIGLELACNGG